MAHKEMTVEERRLDYYTGGKVGVQMEHEFDENIGPLHLTVEAWYKPGRQAPACSDPDSPRFSDPGDPSEFEIVNVTMDGAGVLASILWDEQPFLDAVHEALDEDYEDRRRERHEE